MRLFTSLLFSALPLVSGAAVLEDRTACSTYITPNQAARVQRKLAKSKIVPELVPAFTPQVRVTGSYGSKKIKFGNEFTPLETANAPTINFTAERSHDPATTTYSVFMVDPDVPMEGDVSVDFLHWYYAHAKPSCAGKSQTQEVAFYELPTPGSTTQHRYTFLVYREPKGYKPNAITAQLRPGFDVNAYAKSAGLKLVGANYFLEAITNT